MAETATRAAIRHIDGNVSESQPLRNHPPVFVVESFSFEWSFSIYIATPSPYNAKRPSDSLVGSRGQLFYLSARMLIQHRIRGRDRFNAQDLSRGDADFSYLPHD